MTAVHDGGSGYMVGDTGDIGGHCLPSNIGPARYTVLTLSGSAIATVSIVDHGGLYNVGTACETGGESGGGTSATFDISTVLPAGAIATSAVNNGGLGYLATNTSAIDDAACLLSGTASTLTVSTAPGTIVATYTITDNGGVYVPHTGCTTTATSGVGIGLTIDVNTVVMPDGSMWITTVWGSVTAH